MRRLGLERSTTVRHAGVGHAGEQQQSRAGGAAHRTRPHAEDIGRHLRSMAGCRSGADLNELMEVVLVPSSSLLVTSYYLLWLYLLWLYLHELVEVGEGGPRQRRRRPPG
eukprot:scaffold40686_cov45-Phaeocystis_antarctica.AAC.2